MFNLGVSFKFLTPVRDEGGRSPSRAGVRHHANLETLEGRALLSTVTHAAPAVHAQQAAFVHIPKHPHPGPIVNIFGEGHVIKSPRFYEFYTGAKRGELNAAGMKATYDAAGNLILTGIIAGTVNAKPSTDADSEYYVFGIDRGLTSGPGPFPGRPNIRFDAAVAVSITPAGTSGIVVDLNSGQQTPLDISGIVVKGDHVKVYVPAGTPGIDSAGNGVRPKVVFWAQDAAPSSTPDPATVASFAPDGRDILIAGAPGVAPNRHLL